jgi:hypothetical protein
MITIYRPIVVTATGNGRLRQRFQKSVQSSVQLTGNYYLTLGWLVNAGTSNGTGNYKLK